MEEGSDTLTLVRFSMFNNVYRLQVGFVSGAGHDVLNEGRKCLHFFINNVEPPFNHYSQFSALDVCSNCIRYSWAQLQRND